MCLVLPPEFIEYIIDYLHDSLSTLCACASVCRAWVAPSRFHLFYCRKIIPDSRGIVSTHIRHLLEFLQGSPHIAFCIREFHFSACGLMIWMLDSDWPQVNADLPHLLGILTQLRKLVLRGIPFTGLAPDTRAAFRALFALPCLVDVEVEYLGVAKPKHFTTLLCSSLKHLSVAGSYGEQFTFNPEEIRAADEEIKAVELQGRSPCRLEYLSSGNSVFMRWLLGPQTMIDIMTIRTLEALCSSRHREGLMARLIRRLGPSLENLIIGDPRLEDWEPTKDTIDLRSNPNIRTLTVRTEFNYPLARYVKYLLSGLSAPNIQQITIVVLPSWRRYEMDWRQGWNEVDQVLDGVKFRELREVAIVVNAYHDVDIIRQHLTDQFPSMYDRGILNITALEW